MLCHHAGRLFIEPAATQRPVKNSTSGLLPKNTSLQAVLLVALKLMEIS